MTDTNRIAAWVADLGNHPHVPVLRELLNELERAENRARAAGASASSAGARCAEVEQRLARSVEDAARLAGWIIRNPAGGDPTEVLTLHDRSMT